VLIRNAEVWGNGHADVRLAGTRIAELGRLDPQPGEAIVDARGGALLPGLHDHHIHLAALAAAQSSVRCGPPEVTTPAQFAAALARPGSGWLRAVGYHESVAGLPDARALDALVPDRPLRVQHRSGRMWLLNSPGLAHLLARASPPPGLEREGGRFTGRLFDEDAWLRAALGSSPPDFAEMGAQLAAFGVTGLTDMSPANDTAIAAHFAAEHASGHLPQRCVLAGKPALEPAPGIMVGPVKLHLHEAALPDFDAAVAMARSAHRASRAVAVHCTTEVELVFALAVIDEAGAMRGDRIEHAGIAPDGLVAEIARLGLQVVSQPHFIAERGDHYLRDVPSPDHAALYRLAAFARAGVVLAGGSDAPFGSADPWAAMRAAVSRRTAKCTVIGVDEALDPEAALALYLADPLDLRRERRIVPGEPADLCLLSLPWSEARERLDSADVRATWIAGSILDAVDQPPPQRHFGPDPLA
jgi:predicted amidohydrolase YtcJ